MAKKRGIYGKPKDQNIIGINKYGETEKGKAVSLKAGMISFQSPNINQPTNLTEIAVLNPQQAIDLIETSKSVNMFKTKDFNKPLTYVKQITAKDASDTYKSLYKKNFFHDIANYHSNNVTNKFGTGDSLIKNVVKQNEQINSWIAKGKQSWVSPKRTLELFERIKGGDFNNLISFDFETLSGKDKFGQESLELISEMSFGVYNKNLKQIDMMQTLVGINPTQATNLRKIVDEIGSSGFVTGKHKVIAERLMLEGLSLDFIEDVEYDGIKGLKRFKNFASTEMRIKHGMDTSVMKKAIDNRVQMFADQSAHKVGDMMPHESLLLKALGGDSRDIYAGFNAAKFDIDKLEMAISDPEASPVFKEKAMPLLERVKRKLYDVYEHTKIVSPRASDIHSKQRLKEIQASGMGAFKLEVMTESVHKGFFEQDGFVAHLGETDTKSTVRLIEEMMKGDAGKLGMYSKVKSTDVLENAISVGQDVYATKGLNAWDLTNNGILAFTLDPNNNKAVFLNSDFRLDASGNTQEGSGWTPFKKGSTLRVGEISKFQFEEEYLQDMRKLHPQFAKQDLYSVMIEHALPQNTQDRLMRGMSPTYMIGTKDSINAAISGKIAPFHEVFGEGVDLEQIERIKEKSYQSLMGDPALRDIRNYNPTKIEDKIKIVKQVGTKEKLLEESRKLAQKIAKGGKISLNEQEEQIQKMIYSLNTYRGQAGTIENLLTQFDYLKNYSEELEYFINQSQGSPVHFKEYVERFNKHVIGKEDAIHKGNFFELDLSEVFKGATKIDLRDPDRLKMNVNLDNEYRIGSKVFGLTQSVEKEASEVDQRNMMKKVNTYLNNKIQDKSQRTHLPIDLRDANKSIIEKMKWMKKSGIADQSVRNIDNFFNLNNEGMSLAKHIVEASDPYINAAKTKSYFSMGKGPEAKNKYINESYEAIMNIVFPKENLGKLKLGDMADNIQKVRYADTERLVRDLVTGLADSDTDLMSQGGNIFAVTANESIHLKLPKEIIQGGMYKTELGGQLVSPVTGFYGKPEYGGLRTSQSKIEKISDIKLQSSIGQAHDTAGKASNSFKKAFDKGTIGDRIRFHMKQIGKVIGEAPDVTSGDLQDQKAMYTYSLKGLMDNLGVVSKEIGEDNLLSGIHGEDREAILKAIRSGQDRMPISQLGPVSKNEQILLRNIVVSSQHIREGKIGGTQFGLEYDKLLHPKDIEEFKRTFFESEEMAVQFGHGDTRRVSDQVSRVQRFISEKGDESRYGLFISSKKTLDYTSPETDRLGRKIESFYRLSELNIDNKRLRSIAIAMGESRNKEYMEAAAALELVHTEEGAAVLSRDIYNKNVIPNRLTEQRIDFKKLVALDKTLEDAEEVTRRKAGAFRIKIEQGGVVFEYANTNALNEIKEGQKILTTMGIDGVRAEAIDAKYKGFLSLGVFEKGSGMFIDQDTVQGLIDKKGVRTEQEAFKYLHDEFDLKFFMKSTSKEGHTKALRNNLEKKTISFIDQKYLSSMQKYLKGIGIDTGNIEALTFTSNAALKHGDIDSVVQEVAGAMYSKGYDSERVAKGLGEFIDGDIEIRDNKVFHENLRGINYDKLNKILGDKELMGDSSVLKSKLASYGIFSSHVDTLHRNIIKVTDRHGVPMSLLRKEEDYIQRMSEYFGDEKKIRGAFELLEEKERTLAPVLDSMQRDLRTRGDSPVDKIKAITLGEKNKISKTGKRLINESGLEDEYDNILNTMINTGKVQEATMGSVLAFHEVSTAEKAIAWNAGRMPSDKFESVMGMMEDSYKFKKRKITDLLFELNKGEGSDFNKALMIDLHIESLGPNDQIYNKIDKTSQYIAMPYFKADRYSEREAKTVVQQKISSLQMSVKRYQDAIEGGERGLSEEAQQAMKLDLMESADVVRKEISGMTGKKRQLAEASMKYLGGSRYTASGHIMYGGETSEFLRGLMFEGESIKDLAGRSITPDYALAGEDHFAKYFEKEYMQNFGLDVSDVDLAEAKMRRHLQTEGATELLIREPQDYAKSTRFSKVFLDESIKNDNMLRISGTTVSAMGGDFDSDFFALARFDAQATITGADGKSITKRIDYTQYKQITGSGGTIDSASEKIFRSVEASMYETAYLNRTYNLALKDIDLKDYEDMNQSILRRHKFLDAEGMLGSRRELIGDLTVQQKSNVMQNFESINKNLGIDYNKHIKEGDYSQVLDDKLGSSNLEDVLRDTDISDMGGARKNIAQAMHLQSDNLKLAAQTTKLAAGESNYLLHGIKQSLVAAGSHGINLTNDEMLATSQMTLAFQEFFLAGKGAKEIDYGMLDKLTEGLKRPNKLLEFAKETIWDRKEFDAMGKYTKEETMGLMKSAVEKINKNPLADRFLKQTITEMGAGSSPLVTSGKKINFADYFLEMVYAHAETKDAQTMIKSDIMRQVLGAAEGSMAATRQKPESMTSGKMLDSLHDMMRGKITGKNLAFSALGLAGAVMVAGFVGGNPLEPSTRQAEKQSEDMYQMAPSMSDQQMTPGQGGQQGYIININADTRRGRKHAEASIRDAVAMTQQSSNVNISMNIRDSWGNISDRDMQTRMRRMF